MDGRRNPNYPGYEYKELRENHLEILRLKICGLKDVQIAEQLQLTPVTVQNVLNSPIYRPLLQELQTLANCESIDIGKRIAELAPKALERLEEILTYDIVNGQSVSPALLKGAAVDLLSMAGYGKTTKVSGNITHNHLSSEEIESIKQRAREIQQNEMIVEAEIT